jgi:hypothetical protein
MKKNIKWYVSRLRKMSLIELGHRIIESLLYFKDCLIYKKGWSETNCKNHKNLFSSPLGDKLLDHQNWVSEMYSFQHPPKDLLFDNRVFFKQLQLNENFDIREYWESQRFNDLLIFAINDNAEAKVFQALESWMQENKPLKGLNYISTMECAIRCVNLYGALCILNERGNISKELLKASYTFFSVNYRLIKNRISKYSSRGNHTLFEYAGLVVCSIVAAPEKKKYWVNKCLNEFDYQTLDDGSGVEQSTAYHLFNIEITWLIESYFTDNATNATKLTQAMLFCADFWTGEQLIRIGDSDSSILFSRALIKDKLTALKTQARQKNIYPNCGIVSFKNKNLQGYFKYGSLGLAPLFGHGHYDFLSLILLDEDGNFITADAQTYLYNTDRRSDFRSSKYHSMPVNGQDDIKQISKFSWERDSAGELESDNGDWISAHYKRADGTIINRSFKLITKKLIVVDQLIGSDKSLVTKWLVLNKEECFHFYIIDANKTINKLLPSKFKLDASEQYNKLEYNLITELKLAAKANEKIVTIVDLANNSTSKKLSDIAKDVQKFI